jgi:hypothetical protein
MDFTAERLRFYRINCCQDYGAGMTAINSSPQPVFFRSFQFAGAQAANVVHMMLGVTISTMLRRPFKVAPEPDLSAGITGNQRIGNVYCAPYRCGLVRFVPKCSA